MSRVRRCASSSEIFRLTVGSGMPSLREAAERLPPSTAASSVVMAAKRSISIFQKTKGYVPKLADTNLAWKVLHPADKESSHGPEPSERRRLHAIGQGGASPQGLAPRLCPHGTARRLAEPHHARSGAIHRGADQRLSGDRQRRGSALYPASWRTTGLPARH